MGNCVSNPKTDEGLAPEPEPDREEVMNKTEEVIKAEQQENGEDRKEETPMASDDKSLGTFLNEKEEKAETADVKAEATTEEQPKIEELKAEAVEENKEEAKAEQPKPEEKN